MTLQYLSSSFFSSTVLSDTWDILAVLTIILHISLICHRSCRIRSGIGSVTNLDPDLERANRKKLTGRSVSESSTTDPKYRYANCFFF